MDTCILKYSNDGRFWHRLSDYLDYPVFYGSIAEAKAAAERLWSGQPIRYRIENLHGEEVGA